MADIMDHGARNDLQNIKLILGSKIKTKTKNKKFGARYYQRHLFCIFLTRHS